MDRPISDLILALSDDCAVLLDKRGVPALPNTGWAGKYMNIGYNLSGDMNTFQMQHDGTCEITDDDEKDLNIIARKVGYSVFIEPLIILFKRYSAWEY